MSLIDSMIYRDSLQDESDRHTLYKKTLLDDVKDAALVRSGKSETGNAYDTSDKI